LPYEAKEDSKQMCMTLSNAKKEKQKSKCRLLGRNGQKTKTFLGIF
jgi:hypothetical protein